MSIETLRLEQFSAFEHADFAFVNGVNVFLGANATGKTHAMKVLYAAVRGLENRELSAERLQAKLLEKLVNVFKPDDDQIGRLAHRKPGKTTARVCIGGYGGKIQFSLTTGEERLSEVTLDFHTSPSAIYLPSREVLAMYRGFIAAYAGRELSFDETYYDACVALSALPLRGARGKLAGALLKHVESALGGKVTLEGDRFYISRREGNMEAHLVSEGLRKIGSLAHLISNGSLSKHGVLFWDEPEANLNPELITRVADLLLELAQAQVQIFITTHDYLLAHRLSLISEYRKQPAVPIRFFTFYRAELGEAVQVAAGSTMSELPNNPIIEEFARHYDFERGLFDAAGVGPS